MNHIENVFSALDLVVDFDAVASADVSDGGEAETDPTPATARVVREGADGAGRGAGDRVLQIRRVCCQVSLLTQL